MATQWLRRAWLLAACASALLLAACGGGSIVSQFHPGRVIAFGDAMGDVGQNGSRYTVNDGSVNVWTLYVANAFGLGLTPSKTGGLGFATGNARVVAEPDAGGRTDTLTVKEQIDAYLGTGSFGGNDLVLVSAGSSDVIVQAQAALTGAQTQAQMLENVGQAGRDLAAQVRRLVAAGASHVVVGGVYNFGRSPWAAQTSQGGLLEAASARFNQQLLVALVDLGASVLYVDAALQVNLVTANADANGLTDVTNPVCTSIDTTEGIGTGTNQVNSNLCNTGTLRSADYVRFEFADRVYLSPRGHVLLGDYAFNRIRERW